MLNGVNFGRPLLAVVKTDQEECQKASLKIYDLRNTFPPYTVVLPKVPTLVDKVDSASKNQFIFWFPQKKQECRAAPEIKVKNSSIDNSPKRISPLSEMNNLPVEAQRADPIDDFKIETIDKDVLNSLREYVGIDYKGASRHHKLFHLVCNYLLLRFLISYGITTESVLQDFKSTRNRLLNMSNKDLGKALTDQLKGLLASDYNDDLDSPTWFDDIENDIDWLKDVGGEKRHKVKRDTYSLSELGDSQWNYGKRVKFANLEGGEEIKPDDFRLPKSLHIVPTGKGDSASNKLLMSRFQGLDQKSTYEEDIEGHSKGNGENKNERHRDNFNSKNCTLPRPIFDSLTVGKTDFKWDKVKRLPQNGKMNFSLSIDAILSYNLALLRPVGLLISGNLISFPWKHENCKKGTYQQEARDNASQMKNFSWFCSQQSYKPGRHCIDRFYPSAAFFQLLACWESSERSILLNDFL